MKGSKETAIKEHRQKNRCLSCGTTENMGKRRYCSIECRQKLRYTLNIRTGLLRALNTRYATFYFTENLIILDILPYNSKEIFSYIFPRSPDKKPVEDFKRMADILGNAWWDEKRRTNRRYLASRHLVNQAKKNNTALNSMKPIEIKKPSVIGKSLIYLKLSKSALESSDLPKTIKTAYRQQAKKCHPDHGGDAASFRRIQKAYEQMSKWLENPVFIKRSGFPDKWFYDSCKNQWIQPIPLHHS